MIFSSYRVNGGKNGQMVEDTPIEFRSVVKGRIFFKVDLGVNFAPRFFGVTPRFCSAAATAVLSYTTIRVGRGRCSVELHQGLNIKKKPGEGIEQM